MLNVEGAGTMARWLIPLLNTYLIVIKSDDGEPAAMMLDTAAG